MQMHQASADQRTRLMTTTEKLDKTSDRVKNSRRTMLETEELGVSILQDLHSQRQSLLHAHGTVIIFLGNVSFLTSFCSVFLNMPPFGPRLSNHC